MARIVGGVLLLWVVGGGAWGQSPEVGEVLARYGELRPTAEEQAMYRLDWAGSLGEALERGKKEERPVLLVIIHARYGDLESGHC